MKDHDSIGSEILARRGRCGIPLFCSAACAFLDIQGVSEQLLGPPHVQSKLSRRIHFANERAKHLLNINRQSDLSDNTYRARQISDSFFLAVPTTRLAEDPKKAIIECAFRTADYQLTLALSGLFCRGGISFGELFMDDDDISGAALVRAVRAEKCKRPCAAWIDECAAEHIPKARHGDLDPWSNWVNGHFVVDEEHGIFLNYLVSTVYGEDDLGPDSDMLMRHARMIERNLQAGHATAVNEKYKWLASYHNYFVCTCPKGGEETTMDPVDFCIDGFGIDRFSRLA